MKYSQQAFQRNKYAKTLYRLKSCFQNLKIGEVVKPESLVKFQESGGKIYLGHTPITVRIGELGLEYLLSGKGYRQGHKIHCDQFSFDREPHIEYTEEAKKTQETQKITPTVGKMHPLVKRVMKYEAEKKLNRAERLAARERRKRMKAEGSCGRKVKYKTYTDALKAFLNPGLDSVGLRIYKCLVCTGYHIGHTQSP